MKATTFAAALASAATMVDAGYFSILSARSASPIHLQSLAANDFSVWIGKDTAAYCPSPSVPKKDCPKGKYTNFAISEDGGSLSMGAVVPGGQQVYIDADTGALHYTQAHSASVPEGAKIEGWQFHESETKGGVSTLTWRKRGFLACSNGNDAEEGPWKVYVDLLSGHGGKNCLGFDAIASNNTKPDAWQYQ